jgi:hypothetical protein
VAVAQLQQLLAVYVILQRKRQPLQRRRPVLWLQAAAAAAAAVAARALLFQRALANWWQGKRQARLLMQHPQAGTAP